MKTLLPFLFLAVFVPNVVKAQSAVNFTPESIRVAFVALDMFGSYNGEPRWARLFLCPALEEWYTDRRGIVDPLPPRGEFEELYGSCTFELMGDVDLAEKSGGWAAEVPVGAYDELYIDRCLPPYGMNYEHNGREGEVFFVKGKVDFLGRTWYTQPGSDPLTTAVSKYGYAAIVGGGSECKRKVRLKTPMVVSEEGVTRMDLFAIPSGMAMAATTYVAGTSCADITTPGALKLCINGGVDLFPVNAEKEVHLESYLISPDVTDTTGAKAEGRLDMLFDQDDRIIGATSQYFFGYEAAAPVSPVGAFPFGRSVLEFSKNTERDSYLIVINRWDREWRESFLLKFEGFLRANHTGELSLDKADEPGHEQLSYRAIKMP